MINTIIFDLDGTLVQTERLKAISYAQAAVELCPNKLKEDTVIEGFKEVIGKSRKEVAVHLLEQFGLEAASQKRMTEFAVKQPWQAYVQIRLRYYDTMLQDPQIILNNQWTHNVALLETARRACQNVALATMSQCEQANRVLNILGLSDTFDFVATRDDVNEGKPNPEIYLLVADELGVLPEACLVIEDSPSGIEAALNAGMVCIAVTTPFTKDTVRKKDLLPDSHIVDDPAQLPSAMAHIVAQH